MKRLGVKEFRETFRTIDEPIEVVRWNKTVGWYYPGEFPPGPTATMKQVLDGYRDAYQEDHDDRDEDRQDET